MDVHVPNLDVGLPLGQVVLLGQLFAHVAVARIIVDGGDFQLVARIVVQHAEQAHVAHQLGREELGNEALVLEVAHGEVHGLQPVAAGDVREPAFVLFRRVLTDAADVHHHVEAEGVGVDAPVPGGRNRRLIDHVSMGLDELQHERVRHQPLVVQGIEDGVMPEAGPALVHDLGLALGIEVLGDLAHDAHHLALPGLQQGCILLDEIEDVLLGLRREAAGCPLHVLLGPPGQGAPQFVHLGLEIFLPLAAARLLLGQGQLIGPLVAIHPVVHQGMAGIQQFLDLVHAVTLLALGDVVARVDQVIDDGRGVSPGAEQVVALEKGVVPVRGMGNHQGLHRHGVFFHEIGDAGIGVDDDLVGQAHLPPAVGLLGHQEVLAEGPVMVVHRHAHRRVGIHHLLGADDLQLVRIGVEPVLLGNPRDLRVVFVDQLESPLRRRRQRPSRPGAALALCLFRPGRQVDRFGHGPLTRHDYAAAS